MGILPFTSQYIFFLLLFVVHNRVLFQTNSEIHNINTRYGFNFHLTAYKNGAYYTSITSSWRLHLIVVRRFEYADDPESYASGSVATGRASHAEKVEG